MGKRKEGRIYSASRWRHLRCRESRRPINWIKNGFLRLMSRADNTGYMRKPSRVSHVAWHAVPDELMESSEADLTGACPHRRRGPEHQTPLLKRYLTAACREDCHPGVRRFRAGSSSRTERPGVILLDITCPASTGTSCAGAQEDTGLGSPIIIASRVSR